MKRILSTLLIIPTFSFAASALTSQEQKLSYTLGAQVGNLLKQQNVALDKKALFQGISDVLDAKKITLSDKEMRDALDTLRLEQEARNKSAAVTNLSEGKSFLAKNAKRKGVVSLENGIQYEILKKGDGKTHPNKNGKVTVHYEGSLIDGTVFDSSYKRGQTASFPLDRVIKGWTETIPLMSKGATWNIYIPSEMAYGAQGAGGAIGPNQTLIFKVELISID